MDIVRDKIQIDNVPYYGMVTNDIGYLQLSGFTMDAGREVRNAVSEIKRTGRQKN